MLTIKDFSNAFYALSKAKGYAATVILTLAVTLGTLLATFNLNYTIIAAPLPYQDEDRLIVGNTPIFNQNVLHLADDSTMQLLTEFYLQDNSTFDNTALVGYSYVAAALRDKADTPKVLIAYTTPGYMQMYQMPLVQGRAFSAEEDVNSHVPVAIISERVWRQHYNADPQLVGSSIQIADTAFKVIGVAADSFIEPRFIGPNRSNDIWLPWDFNPDPCSAGLYGRSCFVGWHFLLGKLHSANDHQAVSQQLTASLSTKFQDAIVAIPDWNNLSISFQAQPLRQKLLGNSAGQTFWLFVGSLVLLCIASANTLNLVLSRAMQQQRSMAIQAALGAQKKHIFTQVLAEMLLLLVVALLLALLIAQAEYRLLHLVAELYLPRVAELQLNLPTIVFAITIILLLGISFASLVVRQINYRVLNSLLQSSGKGSGLQISAKARQLLIISQVAMTAVLLVACMMVMQQAAKELHRYIGFTTERVYQVDIDEVVPAITSTETRAARLLEKKRELADIRALLAQHPAVQAASVANYAPANFDGVFGSVTWTKSPDSLDEQFPSRVTTTDQHFLSLFDIELLSGRNFTAQEVIDNRPVLIVNASFANTVWPEQQAVGQRLGATSAWEVIGVVADFTLIDQYSATEPLRVFTPNNVLDGGTLLYQLKPGMSLSRTELNHIMAQVSPIYRAAAIFSLAQNVKRIQFAQYLAAGVTSGLSLLTLLLAAVGIYGVLSYSVQLRRFELGVRMAIGARPATILRQLLGENLKPVVAGLVLAALALVALWLGLQQTTLMVELSAGGFALPLVLIVLLTVLTSLLSVWSIIRKPAIYALKA